MLQDEIIIIIVFHFERNSQKWWFVLSRKVLISETIIPLKLPMHYGWYFDIDKNQTKKDTNYSGYSGQTFSSYACTERKRHLRTRHCNVFKIAHLSLKLWKKLNLILEKKTCVYGQDRKPEKRSTLLLELII